MHLLLPPSEGKSAGGRGRPMRSRGALAAEGDVLWQARLRAVQALDRLLVEGPDQAAAALLLPPAIARHALRANATVLDSPTMPALRRYRGVVYEGLDHEHLSPTQQRVAGRSSLIFTGLWGVLRGDEPVPDYRVPAKATLPGLGIAGTFWRPVLEEVVPPMVRRGLVVDLRSSDYAAMWRPDRRIAARTVVVRVLSPLARGGYGIVSHTSKLAKGRLAAALVRRIDAGRAVEAVEDVLAAWADIGGADARSALDGSPTAAARVDLYTV